jgi:hypothetical protein
MGETNIFELLDYGNFRIDILTPPSFPIKDQVDPKFGDYPRIRTKGDIKKKKKKKKILGVRRRNIASETYVTRRIRLSGPTPQFAKRSSSDCETVSFCQVQLFSTSQVLSAEFNDPTTTVAGLTVIIKGKKKKKVESQNNTVSMIHPPFHEKYSPDVRVPFSSMWMSNLSVGAG